MVVEVLVREGDMDVVMRNVIRLSPAKLPGLGMSRVSALSDRSTLQLSHSRESSRRLPLPLRPPTFEEGSIMASTDWKNLTPDHSLSKFAAELPGILEECSHNEMYGVKLEAPSEG